MSEIYSDKLPECCADCPCLDELWFCELINEWVDKTSDGKKFDYYHDRHPSCPIKSLSVLTSKLAESDAYKLRIELAGADETIAQLNQQLEEYKQSLKETIDHYEKYCSEINHQNIMLYAAACNAQQSSQDKISFAVEQLEKLKEWAHDNASYVLGDFASVWEDALLDELDNQIKQLKEGK